MHKSKIEKQQDRAFTLLMTDPEVSVVPPCKLSTLSPTRKHVFRALLAAKQAFSCYYCSCHMTLVNTPEGQKQPKNLATFEHLKDAFTEGGKNDSCAEVVLACFKCNSIRGSTREKAAVLYYSNLFDQPRTMHELLRHPKVGWAGIIKAFGLPKFPNERAVGASK